MSEQPPDNTLAYKKHQYELFINDWLAPSQVWCNNNLQGNWACIMHYWSFELKNDAILFELTWG